MFYAHLKQGLRLNRTIGLILAAYTACLAIAIFREMPVVLWSMVRVGVFGALTVLFIIVNEWGLRTLKQHPKLDELLQEKMSLLFTLLLTGYITLGYVLTGQLAVLLFATLAVLQAQMYGHQMVARMLLLFFGLLTLVTIPMGYPVLLGFRALSWPIHIQLALILVPFAFTLFHFGSIVSTLVFSTTSKVNKLQSLAATDGLTGLINRRQFNHQLDAEIARSKRYKKPLSLALFDIDDFKKINDFYGHQTGDRILKELGALLISSVRESDISARYGGEEFALILPETSQIDAYELLERLRASIEHTVFCLPDNPMTATISVGVAQLDPEQPKGYELIERADAALYEAKRQGKNQVVYGVLPIPKVTYPPFTP